MYRFKGILKRATAAVFCLALAAGLAVPAAADELPLRSEAAVLMDAETGQVLYSKNMDKTMHPASITKIMTGMLALTYLDPQDTITATSPAIDAVPYDYTKIYLAPGEQLTVEQAMYATALISANDAANVLAVGVSGSIEEFAELMNSTAAAVGAKNTHFANANGLSQEEHYTTAYDMACIARAAIKVPGLTTYFSTLKYDCGPTNMHTEPRVFVNQNGMLQGEYKYDGIVMAKTGWTEIAQCTLVTVAERDGMTLISVVLRASPLEPTYEDTHKLLDYGFENYSRLRISGEEIGQRLELGDFIPMPEQEYSLLVPAGSDIGDIAFSFEDELPESASSAMVTVKASVGEYEIPAVALTLQRAVVETEPPATESPVEETAPPTPEPTPEPVPEPEPVEEDGINPAFLLKPALIVLAVLLLIIRKAMKR